MHGVQNEKTPIYNNNNNPWAKTFSSSCSRSWQFRARSCTQKWTRRPGSGGPTDRRQTEHQPFIFSSQDNYLCKRDTRYLSMSFCAFCVPPRAGCVHKNPPISLLRFAQKLPRGEKEPHKVVRGGEALCVPLVFQVLGLTGSSSCCVFCRLVVGSVSLCCRRWGGRAIQTRRKLSLPRTWWWWWW